MQSYHTESAALSELRGLIGLMFFGQVPQMRRLVSHSRRDGLFAFQNNCSRKQRPVRRLRSEAGGATPGPLA